jgi:hypothetical protein
MGEWLDPQPGALHLPRRPAGWLCPALWFLLLALLSPVCAAEPAPAPQLPVVKANPFDDIPAGDPAYADIQQLVAAGIMEGFPDGQFKGGKLLTRYDLALVMARTRARVEEMEQRGYSVTPEEQQLIDKLNREVGVELSLLGVRVDAVERRVQVTENRAAALDAAKSNVRINGFYRLQNNYVMAPFNFDEYPFLAPVNQFYNLRDYGLQPLQQEAFLRFNGRPVIDGIPYTNVEAFAELRTLLVGAAGLRLTYSFAPNPSNPNTVAGDWIDNPPTGLQDAARVFFNRAHFTTRTKNLNFRAFSNESAADLGDPNILFTVDTLAPFSGVEINGGIKRFSYSSSVLKQITVSQNTGVDPRNITQFNALQVNQSDIYTLRLAYAPIKNSKEHPDDTLIFGGTYVERALDYITPGAAFKNFWVDAQYLQRHDNSRLDTVLTLGLSEGIQNTPGIGTTRGEVFKLDASYAKEGFLASFKAYGFGVGARPDVAQNQFVDTTVNFNFKRAVTTGLPNNIPGLIDPSTRGEHLYRLQLRNDWQGKGLEGIKNLVLSGVVEMKYWNQDPNNPLLNDGDTANRFYVQALVDVTNHWHLELYSEVLKSLRIDARVPGTLDPPVKGAYTNTVRSDWKIQKNLSFITEYEFKTDLDSLTNDFEPFKMFRQKYEFPWQATRRFFLKAGYQRISNSDIQLMALPVTPINGRQLAQEIVEMNWVALPKLSFKTLYVIQLTKNARFRAPGVPRPIPIEDNNTNIVSAEMDLNFSPTLKLRYIYSAQDTVLARTNVFPLFLHNIRPTNHFGELLYTPQVGTELRLTFGYEYENPNDPLDNGPAKFWNTEKILQVRAQTDF